MAGECRESALPVDFTLSSPLKGWSSFINYKYERIRSEVEISVIYECCLGTQTFHVSNFGYSRIKCRIKQGVAGKGTEPEGSGVIVPYGPLYGPLEHYF